MRRSSDNDETMEPSEQKRKQKQTFAIFNEESDTSHSRDDTILKFFLCMVKPMELSNKVFKQLVLDSLPEWRSKDTTSALDENLLHDELYRKQLTKIVLTNYNYM
mgnify:CR=1 FL=1